MINELAATISVTDYKCMVATENIAEYQCCQNVVAISILRFLVNVGDSLSTKITLSCYQFCPGNLNHGSSHVVTFSYKYISIKLFVLRKFISE